MYATALHSIYMKKEVSSVGWFYDHHNSWTPDWTVNSEHFASWILKMKNSTWMRWKGQRCTLVLKNWTLTKRENKVTAIIITYNFVAVGGGASPQTPNSEKQTQSCSMFFFSLRFEKCNSWFLVGEGEGNPSIQLDC